MKIAASAAAVLIATPAFANIGPHLHPHGSEAIVLGVILALTVAASVALARLRRRR